MSTATAATPSINPASSGHLATARRYASHPHDWPVAPRFNLTSHGTSRNRTANSYGSSGQCWCWPCLVLAAG
jgi:hypothetical protein